MLRTNWIDDLALPTLMFAALGAMSWAVRGCAGYGGSDGCIFAGVLWGTAWWYLARSGRAEPNRRYASGWIVLAMTIGVGLSGARGWMQWASFFEGKLQTNYAAGEYVPISRVYGFLWLFIAGVPWAGIGACLLAWCGSLRETRVWHWALRIACGFGGALLLWYLFHEHPGWFLPLYDSMAERYRDVERNPNLLRLTNDCRFALLHLGAYLGWLFYELARRDWKNVTLIATVGLVNGAGWSLCQNWKWAPQAFSGADFNWWRCWESSGGISIGIALGLAYFLVNRPLTASELAQVRQRRSIAGPNFEWLVTYLGLLAVLGLVMAGEITYLGLIYDAVLMAFGVVYYLARRKAYAAQPAPPSLAYGDPNLERLGLFLGVLFGLGFSLRNGLKGWCNIYIGREEFWGDWLWRIIGPALLLGMLAICAAILWRPLPRNFAGDRFPRATAIMWLVLIVQNILAQLVTGPRHVWSEFAFGVYYLLLLAITGVIVVHFSRQQAALLPAKGSPS